MLRSRRSTISGRSKVLITTVVLRAGCMPRSRLPVPGTRLWRRLPAAASGGDPGRPSGLLRVHLQGCEVDAGGGDVGGGVGVGGRGGALRRPAAPLAEEPLAPAPG